MLLSYLSINVPAKRLAMTIGKYVQNVIIDTAMAEFVSLYIQIVIAKFVIALPNCDILWLIQKIKNCLNPIFFIEFSPYLQKNYYK
jgi:hypothetical protein